MYSKIENVLLDYCKLEKIDYAYMLDGNWGRGKSYFIRNHLISEIKNIEKDVLYISLNGLINLDDIKSQFFDCLIINKIEGSDKPLIKKMANISSVFGKITDTEIFGIKAKKNDLKKIGNEFLNHFNPDKIVLIIDDLERISQNINCSDVLGYIYDNFVDKGIKVIVIGNSKEIKNDKENYDKIKEKLFRRIIKFDPNTKKLIENFLKSKLKGIGDSDFEEYIKSKETYLVSLVIDLNEGNLRTLDFFIDNFYKIFMVDNEIVKERQDFLFLFTFVFSLEYKNGDLEKDDHYIEIQKNGSFWVNDREKGKEYIKKLIKNYNLKVTNMYIDTILNFILTGYLDVEKFIKELESKFIRIKDSFIKEEIQALGEGRFFYLEKDDLDKNFSSLWEKLTKNCDKLNFNEIIRSYDLIEYMASREYISIKFDLKKEIKKIILKNFEHNKVTDYFSLEHEDIFKENSLEVTFKNEMIKLRREKILENNKKYELEELLEYIKEIQTKCKSIGICPDFEYDIYPSNLFFKIKECKLIKAIKEFNNCGLTNLKKLIERHYVRTDLSHALDIYKKNLPALKDIQSSFRENLSTGVDNIRELHLKSILESLEITIEKLEDSPK